MPVTAPRANQAQIETEKAGTTAGLFRCSSIGSLLNSALEGPGLFARALLQDEADAAKQRIRHALQAADHRPDSPPLDEPAPGARLSQAACPSHQRRQLRRTAHGLGRRGRRPNPFRLLQRRRRKRS